MRCRSGLQCFDQTQLCTRSKMRVDVRALLGTMSELRLHRLDGVATRHRLACDRVAPKGMVAEGSKPERLLHGDHGPLVAVDVAGKAPVLAEQELWARVSLTGMPADGVENILGQIEDIGLVVLAASRVWPAGPWSPAGRLGRRRAGEGYLGGDCVQWHRPPRRGGRVGPTDRRTGTSEAAARTFR